MSQLRTRIFDLSLPGGVHRCHASYCAPSRLPDRREVLFRDFRILYLLKGSGSYEDEDHKEQPLTPGTFLLRPPRRRHVIRRFSDSAWREFALVLPEELYNSLVALGTIPLSPLSYHWPVTRQSRQQLEALFSEIDDAGVSQGGQLLHKMQAILLAGTRNTTAGKDQPALPPAVQKAMHLLSSDLAGTVLMPEVARKVGMGYHAFRKAFVQYAGHSPKEYRIHRRIEKAQALLMDADRPLYDIAYELGYPDPHTFSKQFKQVTGQSPTAYRVS